MHVLLLLLLFCSCRQASFYCAVLGTDGSVCTYAILYCTVQHACAVGRVPEKNKPRKSELCAPCSVDTRLVRPAYHGRLSPAMREKRATRQESKESSPSLSRLIPTASSTPAWARAWGAPAASNLVPAPRSSGPSHTVRVGRPVQTEQNRTEQMCLSSPLRPIWPGQSRGRLGEHWPMTSRTQLPIQVHPNQTGRGTPAPQPEPA